MVASNQQFYELTPDGREVKQTQSNQKKLPKRFWYAVVGLLCIILGFFVVLLILNISGSDKQVLQDATQTLSQQFEECESSKDPQSCRDALRSELAREIGEISVCEGLENDEYANCVTLIAYDKLDESLCNVIDDSKKDDCKDLVYMMRAKAELSLKLCLKILDETLLESCNNQVTTSIIASGLCAEYDVDASLCDAKRRMEDAATSGDAIACEALGGESADICMDIIASVDEDKDGLMRQDEFENGTNDHNVDTDGDGIRDGDEVLYFGTNPTNVDTDGDGFSDQEEINSGFDPLS